MTEAVVDINILSLNRARETVAAIESALAQEGVAKRVWVLDQGSDADNLAILEVFCAGKDVHLEKLRKNLGVAGGRNYLARLGRAPYIVALDNDAIFADRQTVQRAVSYLESHPELAAIGFQILNYTTREIDELSWGYPKAIRGRWNEPFDTIKFVGAGHALVRKHFEAVGGYDERLFFYLEELDLGYRLINHGLKIRYVPEIKIYHNVSPELRVRWDGGRFYYLVRNRLYINAKHGASPLITAGYAAGYMLKGVYNGVLGQALRGVWDALGMIARYRRETPDWRRKCPSAAARGYIVEHDGKLRGSIFSRMRQELFAKLPQ